MGVCKTAASREEGPWPGRLLLLREKQRLLAPPDSEVTSLRKDAFPKSSAPFVARAHHPNQTTPAPELRPRLAVIAPLLGAMALPIRRETGPGCNLCFALMYTDNRCRREIFSSFSQNTSQRAALSSRKGASYVSIAGEQSHGHRRSKEHQDEWSISTKLFQEWCN